MVSQVNTQDNGTNTLDNVTIAEHTEWNTLVPQLNILVNAIWEMMVYTVYSTIGPLKDVRKKLNVSFPFIKSYLELIKEDCPKKLSPRVL